MRKIAAEEQSGKLMSDMVMRRKHSSMLKKLHPLTIIDTSWTIMKTQQWIWAQWGCGWCVSAVATALWETGHVLGSPAQLSALLDFLQPRQTLNSDCYIAMLNKLKDRISRVMPEKKTTFSCNTIIPGPISVWRLCRMFQSLAGLSYNNHCIVQIWHLLTPMYLGWWKMDCAGNIFLTTAPSSQLWENR
jgi:hypothetical protein